MIYSVIITTEGDASNSHEATNNRDSDDSTDSGDVQIVRRRIAAAKETPDTDKERSLQLVSTMKTVVIRCSTALYEELALITGMLIVGHIRDRESKPLTEITGYNMAMYGFHSINVPAVYGTCFDTALKAVVRRLKLKNPRLVDELLLSPEQVITSRQPSTMSLFTLCFSNILPTIR